jgi:V/A-type H+/Na+-transporting ATPase subunit D
MPVRVPPGKAGRLWLVHRLAVAERGRDLLDRKRQALLAHERGLRAEAGAARAAWIEAVAGAERWMARARTAEGEARIDLLLAYAGGGAEADVAWSRLMGVAHPAGAWVRPAGVADLAGLGAGAALLCAADAYAHATKAAGREAAARAALERVAAELALATRRLRALDKRWIPAERAALAALELSLEESEREEAARIRRFAQARDASVASRNPP